jgi:hypothetical protein
MLLLIVLCLLSVVKTQTSTPTAPELPMYQIAESSGIYFFNDALMDGTTADIKLWYDLEEQKEKLVVTYNNIPVHVELLIDFALKEMTTLVTALGQVQSCSYVHFLNWIIFLTDSFRTVSIPDFPIPDTDYFQKNGKYAGVAQIRDQPATQWKANFSFPQEDTTLLVKSDYYLSTTNVPLFQVSRYYSNEILTGTFLMEPYLYVVEKPASDTFTPLVCPPSLHRRSFRGKGEKSKYSQYQTLAKRLSLSLFK